MTPAAAIVLAGERPGGNALARTLGLPAGVLAPLAGKPCLARVLDALRQAESISEVLVCGPAASVVADSRELAALLDQDDVDWLAPATGPAASALAGARALTAASRPYPLLLTSGDHGLLQPHIIDAFQRDAAATEADVVVGLVPYDRVRAAFPDSRRTVLRFADGAYCGSNLFALATPACERALEFWQAVEADRKRPWRIARRLGPGTLLRYLTRHLPLADAFAALSVQAGCRVSWVPVSAARAAVDVDSEADWRLAEQVLQNDGTVVS